MYTHLTGVLPRSIGIAPEKALKMVAWDVAINFVNYTYPNCPKEIQWVIAGSAAGAATTIIGEEIAVVWVCKIVLLKYANILL